MRDIDELLLSARGVLVRKDHRAIATQLDYAIRTGRLTTVLPGIYTAPNPTWQARIRAADAFRPGGIITGAAAALALWWQDVPISAATMAVTCRVEPHYAGFHWERRMLSPDLVTERDGIRFVHPAVSVLDLIPVLGGAAIDEALRRRVVSLDELWHALRAQPGRPGNLGCARLLHESRAEPWSPPERKAHVLLRAARIHGWRANHRIVIDGVAHWVDIAFPKERLVIEIDGWTYHGSQASFVADRWRYARLAANGWPVLAFAASALDDEPDEFIRMVQVALARRTF